MLFVITDDPKSILLLTRTDKPNFVFCLLNRRRKRLNWTEMSYAKDGEVVIKLMLFAGRPDPPSHRGSKRKFFLRGSNTKLFCVIIGLNFDVETGTTFSTVSLHKVDMTIIDSAKVEGHKRLDLTGKTPVEMEEDELNDIDMSSEIWEQMEDIKV
nr:hypothetical protein [Tanacetum cinerariifolium]